MDMSVTIGKLRLPSPVMPAAGPFGNGPEFLQVGPLCELGALVPNSFLSKTGAPSPHARFHRAAHGFISSFGANNLSLSEFISEVLPELEGPGAPVMVDLKAGNWEDMLAMVEQAARQPGIAAIELNLNCPYGAGTPYWKDPEGLAGQIKRAKQAAGEKALVAKAPTGAYPVEEVGRAAQDGGADAFVSFNGLPGCAIDIETQSYRCGAGGGGGYSGPAVKPYALALCRRAAGCLEIPVIGAGGIASGEDALEYLMAGAAAVQVGSANLMRPDAMWRILSEMKAWLEAKGFETPGEIVGKARVNG